MEYPYMVVAFLDEQKVGDVIEPPKNPHVTVKKKFKLIDIPESELIDLLKNTVDREAPMQLRLGDIKNYDSEETKFIEVLNKEDWKELHQRIVAGLGGNIKTRDLHFENDNYLPHVTWKLQGQENFVPEPLCNTTRTINKLYLIKRLHPEVMKVEVMAEFDVIGVARGRTFR